MVKEQILAPYTKFEEIYKTYISDKYKSADIDLKNKIDTVENELKNKKEQEIKDYFEEYKKANDIDFITYEQARINVTLSASKKSLKEQAKAFIDKIVDDLKLIETQEHKAEILVEYKNDLNVSKAITTVTSRFKAIEELKQKQLEEAQRVAEESIQAQTKATKNALDRFSSSKSFVIVPEKKKVKCEINLYPEQLEELRKFLNNLNIEYKLEEI